MTFSPSTFTAADADLIAYLAHGSLKKGDKKGQRRADGVTPYIVHPRRVADLIREWERGPNVGVPLTREETDVAIQAAYLHDVLEDTGLTSEMLMVIGVPKRVIRVVELLTKPDDGPAPPEYYTGIAGDDIALVVKCADRCANLEDALKEVLSHHELRRWKKYVLKTYRDVLPLYERMYPLGVQLRLRLTAIEDALKGLKPELHQQLLDDLAKLPAA